MGKAVKQRISAYTFRLRSSENLSRLGGASSPTRFN
jgi:hypothetical protein